MKILIDVDEEKAGFFLELLKQLKFVKAKPVSPYKSEVMEGLMDAVDEVNLAKEGKVKLQSARELLDEI